LKSSTLLHYERENKNRQRRVTAASASVPPEDGAGRANLEWLREKSGENPRGRGRIPFCQNAAQFHVHDLFD